jgi:hypothetical protein
VKIAVEISFYPLKREMRPHLEGAYRVVFATKFMGPVAS